MNAAQAFGTTAAVLVVGIPLAGLVGIAGFLAADAITNWKYARHPNGAHEPATDDTQEFILPPPSAAGWRRGDGMSRAWKPGDVAVATVHGKPNMRVMATSSVGWVTHHGFAVSDRDGDTTGNVADLRPLVVIDPEDREAVARLAARVWRTGGQDFGPEPSPFWAEHIDAMQAALRELADPTPPRPEEPQGLGAVVEDADGVRWVRIFTHPDDCNDWRRSDDFSSTVEVDWRREYRQVAAVRVLSEGVS